MTETVEICTGRERRRRWSVEDKLWIIGATYEPDACVKQVAASHHVYRGLRLAEDHLTATTGSAVLLTDSQPPTVL